MGATKVVTDETFEVEVLKNGKPVIVDYWAEWCGPCRMVAPVHEEIAAEYADKIDVVKLNIDENPAVSQRYGIMAIPTMNVFSGGQVVKQSSTPSTNPPRPGHWPAIRGSRCARTWRNRHTPSCRCKVKPSCQKILASSSASRP